MGISSASLFRSGEKEKAALPSSLFWCHWEQSPDGLFQRRPGVDQAPIASRINASSTGSGRVHQLDRTSYAQPYEDRA